MEIIELLGLMDTHLLSSKKTWNIVGEDVCNAIKEFLINGMMLGEISETVISLIPKITTPNMVTHFRPISCCNVRLSQTN